MWKYSMCGDGRVRSLDECLQDKDHKCFDLEIREAMYQREKHFQDEAHTGKNISTTATIGCLRNVFLERIYDYIAEPSSQWWSLRGDLIHKLVERPDYDDPYGKRMTEKRLELPVGDVVISGQLDNWRERFLKDAVLKDWKSIGDNGLRYIIQGGPKWEHVWQTNIYRQMALHNGYKVDKIKIVYMSLMDVVTTGEEAILHEFLVKEPAATGFRSGMFKIKMVKEYPSNKKKWACYYNVPEVPIYSKENVMAFLETRVKALHDAFEHYEMPDLPTLEDVDPKDRQTLSQLSDIREGYWKCNGYCYVWDYCKKATPGWSGPKVA